MDTWAYPMPDFIRYRVETDPLHLADPAARTLFGRPPAKPVRCLACGLTSEPFEDRCCWLCCHTGRAELVRSTTLPHHWNRMVREEVPG